MRTLGSLLASMVLAAALVSGLTTTSGAAVGDTARVSVDSSGAEANNASSFPKISSDGRFVAFQSMASNLVEGDTNAEPDAFVHDRQTGITQRVSVDSSGAQANRYSRFPSISADGRFVAFESYASNLVPGDTNGHWDVFVHEYEPDTIAPKIVSVMPARGATGVFRGTNVRVTFSERVYDVKANFKLYRKGSTTPVGAVVVPVEGTNNTKWVLNPNEPLQIGTTYIAKVLADVKDKVGDDLDQNRTVAGDQPMKWSFKTKS